MKSSVGFRLCQILSCALLIASAPAWAKMGETTEAPPVAAAAGWKKTCENLLGKYVAFVDRKMAVKSEEWTLTPGAEDQIAQVLNDEEISDVGRLNQMVGVMLIDRSTQTASPLRQRWMANAIRAALNPKTDWYNRSLGKWIRFVGSAHYNMLANRVSVVNDFEETNPAVAILNAHELTHSYDFKYQTTQMLILGFFRGWNMRSILLRSPVAPHLFNRMERSAIGGQWELVHRIPRAKRDELIKAIDENLYGKKLSEEDYSFYSKILTSGIYDRTADAVAKLQVAGIIPKGELRTEKLWVSRSYAPDEKAFDLSRLIVDGIMKLKTDSDKDASRSMRPILAAISQEDWDLLKMMIDSRPGSSGRAGLLEKMESVSGENLSVDQLATLEKITQAVREIGVGITQSALDKIMIASLENADLSKAEFIAKLEKIHGYSVGQRMTAEYLNPVGGLKLPLMLHVAYLYLSTGSLQGSWARDVQLIVWLLNLHM